jgi:peptide-methionine (R)-S-oxide reductase
MIDRRILFVSAAGLGGLFAFRWLRGGDAQAAQEKKKFALEMTDAEWRAKLTPIQFNVLRQHGTERPFTSPLNNEKRKGVFACAGCDLPLFSSETKYDSGTGWPSFWQPLSPDAIGTTVDRSLMMVRTEVHCSRCGGHQGHVFDDGPKPTGLRYCINGVSLTFKPAGPQAT